MQESSKYPKSYPSIVSVSRLGAQILPNALDNLLQINTVLYNTLGEFNILTHGFTPLEAGYYKINAQVTWQNVAVNFYYRLEIYIGAAPIYYNHFYNTVAGVWQSQNIEQIRYLTPNDTVYVYVQTSNPAGGTILGGLNNNWLTVNRLT